MMEFKKYILTWAGILLMFSAMAQDNYLVRFHLSGKDTLVTPQSLGIRTGFSSRNDCILYIESMGDQLRTKGYITFSVDSVRYDSLSAEAWLYLGEQYHWRSIRVKPADAEMFYQMGWSDKTFTGKQLNFDKLGDFQEKALKYLENNGYPFARLQLDSLLIEEQQVSGQWNLELGPLYKIDSIRVTGSAKISSSYLQNYLDIRHGSIYKKDKLDGISRRILELPFLKETQKWDLTMLGTGSTLNLYLDSKKSSQINALIGFLPSNPQLGGKLLVTGEANLNLKNALGGGETIGLNWQQLQIKSPRLNILFQQPFIFHSRFGLDFNFDLLKKDSSYLNLNLQLGTQYVVSQKQSGRLFYQGFRTNLITVDTNRIKATKELPPFLDVSTNNLGVDYQFNNTDYRLNPRKGNEWYIMSSVGLRNIHKNSTIMSLETDAAGKPFDFGSLYDTLTLKTYLLRLKIAGAHYFRTGKQTTIRTAVNAGWIQTENAFNNEVYQIGGYKLLRGFDEESIYATQYTVGTAEFRYLIGLNAYLFTFADFGWARNNTYATLYSHTYLGTGFGMALETKAGILNLSYAVGKRDDSSFSLRESKIHFGFVSIF